MHPARNCPALLVSAPASGQGKTTVTAALARRYRDRGLAVRVFKIGPDFLDPMVLERAAGAPVYQLDLWMGGEAHCGRLLYEAAGAADVILIEGVMGLFDGEPSSADLAARFGVPVLAVVDASAMAQTFGALALGLATFRTDVQVRGVFTNRVGSEGHYAMLARSLPASIAAAGWLPGNSDVTLPDRHLGLQLAREIADLDARLDAATAALRLANPDLPAPSTFAPAPAPALPPVLAGVRIGIAHDEAFAFIYRANIDVLAALGATLVYFSPLNDSALPEVDALYFPGGYPELHLATLACNHALHAAIRAHHAAGKPIYAECGGMLYLLESLADTQGHVAPMLGLLPGRAAMQPRLAAIALQAVELPEGTLRGHTFHYSRMDTSLTPIAHGTCPNGTRTAEPVFRVGCLTASYIHNYFPSNPTAAARLFAP